MAGCLETVLKRQRLLAGPAGRRVETVSHFHQRYGLVVNRAAAGFCYPKEDPCSGTPKIQSVGSKWCRFVGEFLPETGSK